MIWPLVLPAATVPEADPLELIRFAADARIDRVGLNATAAAATGAADIVAACRAAEVTVNHLESVPWSAITDDAARDRLVDLAATIGAAFVVVGMPRVDTTDIHDGTGPLKLLGEKCLASGIEMAVEHGPVTRQNTVEAAADLVRSLGHGVVVVDLYLHHRIGGEMLDLLAIPPELVGFVRVGDGRESTNMTAAKIMSDSETDRRMPGSGEFPILEMMRTLPEESPICVHVTSERLAERLTPPDRAKWSAKSMRLITGIR